MSWNNTLQERANVAIDVMVTDSTDFDFDALAAEVHAITHDGLTWGITYEIIPIGFTGDSKLRVGCTIVNAQITITWIQGAIEALDGVSSTYIVSVQGI